jgi:hypothetical protein
VVRPLPVTANRVPVVAEFPVMVITPVPVYTPELVMVNMLPVVAEDVMLPIPARATPLMVVEAGRSQVFEPLLKLMFVSVLSPLACTPGSQDSITCVGAAIQVSVKRQ